MKRVLLALIVMVVLAAPAYGAPLSSNELINRAGKYSGKPVEYRGEAIGDVMRRGTHGWVNLHDGGNAIGIWAPVALLERIRNTGDYNHKGDIVFATGTFNQACSEHGGDIDIHATGLTVVDSGGDVVHPIDKTKGVGAAALALVAAFLFVVNRKRAVKLP